MAAKEQLNLAITADSSQAEGALKRVDRSVGDLVKSMESMQPSIDKFAHITGAAIGLGAITDVLARATTSIRDFAMSGIDYMDKLYRMSMSTGASVESLSGMAMAAKLAGRSLDDVAPALQRLTKAMFDARTNATGEAARLFAALKIDPTQFTDSGQAALAVAKQLDAMGYSAEGTAVAMKLLGKGNAELIPFFQELAAQGKLVTKVTTEQARAADQYKDSMIKLQSGASTLGIALANKVLPGLNDILNALLKIKKEEGIFSMLAQALGITALRTFGVEVDPLKRAEADVTDAFSAYAKQKSALEKLQAAKDGGHYVDDKAIDRAIERLAALKKAMESTIKARDKLSKEANAESESRRGKPVSIADDLAKDSGAASAAALLKAEYQNRLEIIKESLAEEEAALSAARAAEIITEVDYIDSLKQLRVEAAKAREQVLVKQWSETQDPAEKLRIIGDLNKSLSDQSKAALDAETALSRLTQKAYADLAKAEAKRLEDARKITDGLVEQVKKAEEENAEIGLTVEQLGALKLARMDAAIAAKEQYLETARLMEPYAQETLELEKQIDAMRRLRAVAGDSQIKTLNAKAIDEQSKAWEKFSDDIERSLTDALMRSFESGNDFGKSFVETLKNTLKTTVLKVVVQAIVNPVMNGVSSILGVGGNSLTGGTSLMSVLSGTTSLAQFGSALLDAYRGSTVGMMGSAVSTVGGGWMGSTYAGAYGTGMGLSPAAAAAAAQAYTNAANVIGTQITSLTSTIGAAAEEEIARLTVQQQTYTSAASGLTEGSAAGTAATWILAIIAGMKMSGDLWEAGVRWDGKYNFSENPLQSGPSGLHHQRQQDIARSLFGDDFVNSKLYAIFSGNTLSQAVHQAAFGGDWEFAGRQIQGTYNSSGFSGKVGTNYHKEGGWMPGFDDDEDRTDWADPTESVQNALDYIYESVAASFEHLGEMFDDTGLADKISKFSYTFNKALGSDFVADMDALSTDLTVSMVTALLPVVPEINARLREQVDRLNSDLGRATAAGNTDLVNQIKAQIALADESVIETFGRLMQETSAVSEMFRMMGQTITDVFGNSTNDVLRLSDSLLQLFGGIEQFNSAWASYYDLYFTAEEKLNYQREKIAEQFLALGKSVPESREAFRTLVESLDITTLEGQKTYAALISLAPAFAQITDVVSAAAAAAEAAARETAAAQETQASRIGQYLDYQRSQSLAAQAAIIDGQVSAAQTMADSANSVADSFRQILADLTDYRSTLLADPAAAVSPQARYAAARQTYTDTAARAAIGDVTAAASLRSVADDFLTASRAANDYGAYQSDFANVLGSVNSVIGVAERQVPIAEQQLNIAQAQLASLESIRAALSAVGTPSVTDAPLVIDNYQQASKDWNNWFATTAIGSIQTWEDGTTQRLSETMGMWTDLLGNAFTFKQSDGFYGLADQSDAFRERMLRQYGKWTGPSFAVGTNYVPGDMLAQVHEGERIIPAADNRALLQAINNTNVIDIRPLLDEIRMLRAEVQSVAGSSGKTSRLLERVMPDGDALAVRTAA